MKIEKMSVDEKGIKSVKVITTLKELEKIVFELKKETANWGKTPNKFNNIACCCPTGSDDSNVTFWIDNPSYIKKEAKGVIGSTPMS